MNFLSRTKTKFFFSLITIALLSSCGSSSLLHDRIQTEEKCECKTDAYWYNDKCWKNYNHDWISTDNVDSLVEAELIEAEKIRIKIGGNQHPINVFVPIPNDDGYAIMVEYTDTDDDRRKTMISQVSKKEMYTKNGKAEVEVYNGSAVNDNLAYLPFATGSIVLNLSNDGEELLANGFMKKSNSEDSVAFSYFANNSISGLGDTHLEIVGDEAFLSGTLGTKAYAQVKDLVENHPNVRTLVLTSIPGSINGEVNMHTGRLIYDAKLTTKVLHDSKIASGGVHLFCAGKERIVEKGAQLGIHSWCCYKDLSASNLPKDHPAHKAEIDYYTLVMGKELGTAFYFQTIEKATFEGVYFMTDEELKLWEVCTEIIGKD